MKHKNKKILVCFLLSVFIFQGLFFAFVPEVKAFDLFGIGGFAKDAVIGLLGWPLHMFAAFTGSLVYVMSGVALGILKMGEIGNVPVVNEGWAITRDLANLFFILFLLIISFGTILRIEGWGYEKTLPRLIIAALLINFSKVIALAIIDLSQVLSLFFINAAGDNPTIYLASFFKINATTDLDASFVINGFNAVMGSMIQIIFNITALFAFGALAFSFLIRIIALWMLVILAPLVWLLHILPKTETYWSQWWEKFLKWCFFAPVASFFVYLSVQSIAITQDTLGKAFVYDNALAKIFPTAMQPQTMFSLFVSIGFLLAGLQVAHSFSSQAPGFVLKGKDWVKGKAKAFGKRAAERAAAPAAGWAAEKVKELPLARRLAPGLMRAAEAPQKEFEARMEKQYTGLSAAAKAQLLESEKDPRRKAYLMQKLHSEGELGRAPEEARREGIKATRAQYQLNRISTKDYKDILTSQAKLITKDDVDVARSKMSEKDADEILLNKISLANSEEKQRIITRTPAGKLIGSFGPQMDEVVGDSEAMDTLASNLTMNHVQEMLGLSKENREKLVKKLNERKGKFSDNLRKRAATGKGQEFVVETGLEVEAPSKPSEPSVAEKMKAEEEEKKKRFAKAEERIKEEMKKARERGG